MGYLHPGVLRCIDRPDEIWITDADTVGTNPDGASILLVKSSMCYINIIPCCRNSTPDVGDFGECWPIERA